jgi:hypothetical protein
MIESSDEFRFALFDFRDLRNENTIREWASRLQKSERAKLNLKLDMLQRYGDELGSSLLLSVAPYIFKLKAKGKVQLRPMLCKGPVRDESEFTLLIGATERDGKLVPSDVVERAQSRRADVLADPGKRRVPHERVN